MQTIDKQILTILKELIAFKSVTPKGLDAINFVEKFLSELGFKCILKEFGSGENKVSNLYAVIGNKSPNICFAGHVDVVPPLNIDKWHNDPFELYLKENKIFGRGTVDMKGAIACYLIAIKNFLENNPNLDSSSISVLLTSDEEGDAINGTVKMLEYIEKLNHKIDFCILGEPTTKQKIGDTIKIGRRGSINFELEITGKQGHVAYPEKAINPIPITAQIINDLNNFNFDQGSEFFQKSNLEITSINTENKVFNIIPNSVLIKFNIRFNNLSSDEYIISEIHKIIKKYTNNYDLKYRVPSKPFLQEICQKIKLFSDIVENSCGQTPKLDTNGGTSDARFIHKYTKTVEFGLNCDSAHKINEFTQIKDLQILYNVYYDCLNGFIKYNDSEK